VIPAKSKYADSKSSAYLRGTWLKTKKYLQTVILAYLRYVSTRIIAPCFRSDKTRTANVLNCFKSDRSSKFIGEVIFKKYVV
jgi:hypothetical protein